MSYKDIAEELWQLLDDIDTGDDMFQMTAKGDARFRDRARKIVAKRHAYLRTSTSPNVVDVLTPADHCQNCGEPRAKHGGGTKCLFLPTHYIPPVPGVRRIVGAVSAFAAYLTTLEKPITLGAGHYAGPIADLLQGWREKFHLPANTLCDWSNIFADE